MKRILIKEEFVEITGDYIGAILLEYLTHFEDVWTKKTADEISEETMLGMSHQFIRKNLELLEAKGFVNSRNNPINRFDKTLQYRVDYEQIEEALKSKGYSYSEVLDIYETGK